VAACFYYADHLFCSGNLNGERRVLLAGQGIDPGGVVLRYFLVNQDDFDRWSSVRML